MITQPRSERLGADVLTLSGPSGSGKGTIVERLLHHREDAQRLPCFTNRAPRPGEVSGEQWHFTDTATIEELDRAGRILSLSRNYGNLYATPFPCSSAEGLTLFEADLLNLEHFAAAGVEVFRVLLLPPSWQEARRRMELRSRISDRELDERIRDGYPFVQRASDFDAVLVNEDLEETVSEMLAIIDLLCRRRAPVIDHLADLQRVVAESAERP